MSVKQTIRGYIITLLVGCFLSGALMAQTTFIKGLRFWDSPEGTRVVFDLNRIPKYRLLRLKKPERLVLDFEHTQLRFNMAKLGALGSDISELRYAKRPGGELRVVFDLRKDLQPNTFTLNPNEKYSHRLVLDLRERTKPKAKKAQKQERVLPVKTMLPVQRDYVIAVDAGHGGDDPGALGLQGTREKDIALAIAKRLIHKINAEPGMRAVLVRKRDYYVGLRSRIGIARRARADLFISIHADAFHDPRAHGASVFILSEHGSSSEAAKWLAKRENRSDLIGGVSLDDKDDVLAAVLLNLSQTYSNEASFDLAKNVLSQLGRVTKLHRSKVQQAGFVVLKSPDIPSILVETGFISNPRSERALRTTRFQNKLAAAMVKGIKRYISKHPRLGNAPTVVAGKARTHKVVRGDTLSQIAKRYGLRLKDLKKANALTGTVLRVGQVLTVPQRKRKKG